MNRALIRFRMSARRLVRACLAARIAAWRAGQGESSLELETVLLNAVPQRRDIEGYVDPREPLRDEGPFGNHTGFYSLPKPYLLTANA